MRARQPDVQRHQPGLRPHADERCQRDRDLQPRALLDRLGAAERAGVREQQDRDPRAGAAQVGDGQVGEHGAARARVGAARDEDHRSRQQGHQLPAGEERKRVARAEQCRERQQEQAREDSDRAAARGRLEVAQREDERRERDHAERAEEEPAQRIHAQAGRELARERGTDGVAAGEQPEAGSGDARRTGGLRQDPGREAESAAARSVADRDRAQPGDEQAAPSRPLELFQHRLLLGQPAADDVAASSEQIEHALVLDPVVDVRALAPRVTRPIRRSAARCCEVPLESSPSSAWSAPTERSPSRSSSRIRTRAG